MKGEGPQKSLTELFNQPIGYSLAASYLLEEGPNQREESKEGLGNLSLRRDPMQLAVEIYLSREYDQDNI